MSEKEKMLSEDEYNFAYGVFSALSGDLHLADWQCLDVVEDDFSIVLNDKSGNEFLKISVADYYSRYRLAKTDREKELIKIDFVEKYGLAYHVPHNYQSARDEIFPLIVSREKWDARNWFILKEASSGVQSDAQNLFLPGFPLGDTHLAVVLCYNATFRKLLLSSRILDRWNVDFAELYENSLKVLRDSTPNDSPQLDREDTDTYFPDSRKGFDSSAILLPDYIEHFKVRGHHTLFVLNDNALTITGSEDDFGLELGLSNFTMAEGYREPLPPIPLVLQNGVVKDLLLPHSHKLFDRLHKLRLNHLSFTYLAQEDVGYPQEDESTVSAPFLILTDKNQRLFSGCTVYDSTPNMLLPKSDIISFVHGDRESDGAPDSDNKVIACAEWEHVMSVAGELFHDTEFYPPYARMIGFPNKEQLQKIGKLKNLKELI